jgi:photosystem II stability/assembly factor-like uncharacterized protein
MLLRIICCMFLLLVGNAYAGIDPRPALQLPLSNKAVMLDLETHKANVFAVGERGIILRSTDEGASWEQLDSPIDVTLTGISFSSEKEGWIVGHESTILHSVDGGATWAINRYQPEEEKFYMSVNFVNPQLGYVLGTDGELWVTEDSGKTWEVTILSVEEWYQNHLFAIEKLGKTALVAAERGGVFYSEDGLTDWQAVPSPYEGSFFGVNVIANQYLIFGMSGHLYLINPSSLEWTKINTATDQFLLDSVATADNQLALVVGRGGVILVLNEKGELVKKIEDSSRVDYTAVAILGESVYLASMAGGVRTMPLNKLTD